MLDKKLIRKFLENKCTLAERDKVLNFFSDEEKKKAFLEIIEADWYENYEDIRSEDIPSLDDVLQSIHSKIKVDQVKGSQSLTHLKKKISPFSYWVAAAVFLLMAISTVFYYSFEVDLVKINELIVGNKEIVREVPEGQKTTIHLADGSIVKLNGGSKLIYPEQFDQRERKVQLVGEGFFVIEKDASRPFVVVSEDIQTTALGTSFNVKAYQDSPVIEVALATGKVMIDNSDISDVIKDPFLLIPGEIIYYDKEAKKVARNTYDRQEKLSWKDGVLHFKDTQLKDVFTILEKWYGVRFKVDSKLDMNTFYTGNYHNESLSNVLKGICFVNDLNYKIEEKTIIIKMK